jgi:lipopolysaccharide transport system permease protein
MVEMEPARTLPRQPALGHEIVIEPNRGWLRIDWREMWEYRDLLRLLVRRDFLAKYKQTLLGPAWFILQPLLTAAMFVVVFGRIAQIPTEGIPAPLFYLCGLLAWNYFAQNVAAGATTFTANAQLFGKVYFPRLVVPAATIVSNLFAFVLQLAPFAVIFCYYKFFTAAGADISTGWRILFVPLLLVQTSLFSLGVSLWMSASTAKYRDLVHLNAFIIQLWMFATPVIYPLSKIPARLEWLAWLNPMAAIVEAFRIVLLGRGELSAACLIASILITLVITISGIVVFQKMERTAVDRV